MKILLRAPLLSYKHILKSKSMELLLLGLVIGAIAVYALDHKAKVADLTSKVDAVLKKVENKP